MFGCEKHKRSVEPQRLFPAASLSGGSVIRTATWGGSVSLISLYNKNSRSFPTGVRCALKKKVAPSPNSNLTLRIWDGYKEEHQRPYTLKKAKKKFFFINHIKSLMCADSTAPTPCKLRYVNPCISPLLNQRFNNSALAFWMFSDYRMLPLWHLQTERQNPADLIIEPVLLSTCWTQQHCRNPQTNVTCSCSTEGGGIWTSPASVSCMSCLQPSSAAPTCFVLLTCGCLPDLCPMAAGDGGHHVPYLLHGFQRRDCGESCGGHLPDVHVHVAAVLADGQRGIFLRHVLGLLHIFSALLNLRLAVHGRVCHRIHWAELKVTEEEKRPALGLNQLCSSPSSSLAKLCGFKWAEAAELTSRVF